MQDLAGISLVTDPLLPPGIIAGLALIAALPVIAALAARRRGAVLRAGVLALLVLALLDPVIRREDRVALSDIAVIVTDRSESNRTGARTARTDAAEAALRAAIAALPNTEVRSISVTPEAGAGGAGTHAFDALTRAEADIPPERFAGAIMITDGQVHDAPASLAASPYRGPLHALITGDRGERDRRILIDAAPRFAIVGQPQTLRFHVEDSGSREAVSVTVALANSSTQTISAVPGVPVELPFTLDRAGRAAIELSVPERPGGELTLANNRAVAVSEGIRDRLRVLLVSGEPHPGERTWRNLLKNDASVDLVHFTILRPPEKQDGTPINELSLIAFPTRELFVDKLSQFDLIIFDRYQRHGILPPSYLANVADYVKNGGAVLVAAGPDYAAPLGLYDTPLGEVLPASPTGEMTIAPFRPHLTAAGERHPVTAGLPGSAPKQPGGEPQWGRWFRLVNVAPGFSGEAVLSGPEDRPLMILSRPGEGRVALLLSDHAWLWTRGYDGGGPQGELLRRFAHWLMKEPDLEEEALTANQAGSDLVIERRSMADSVPPVTVTSPSGTATQVTLSPSRPGLWRAVVPLTETGIYRASDGKLAAVAAAGTGDAREWRDLTATEEILAPLLRETGGAAAWIATEGSGAVSLPRLVKVAGTRALSGAGWLGLKANEASRVTGVSALPLGSTLLALALMLAAIAGLWWREGR